MPSAKNVRAGRAYVEVGADDTKLQAALKRVRARLRSVGAGAASIGARVTAAGAALAAPFAGAVKVFASAGDQLDKMSKRTGVSVEALSELSFAAEQSGADLATLEKGVRTMQRSVNDLGRGLSTQTEAFDDLSLSFRDLEDLSPEEQFKLVADRLSEVEGASKRAALAQQIFGRAGTQLLPLMQDGAEGIEALQQEARDLGLTISTDTATAAADLTDKMNILRKVLRVVAINVGAAIAPAVARATVGFTGAAKAVIDFVKENGRLLLIGAGVATALLAVGAALTTLGFAAIGLGGLFGLLATAIGLVSAPMILLVGAAAAALAAVLRFTGGAGAAINFFKSSVSSILDPFGDAERGMTSLGEQWASVVGFMEDIWFEFKAIVAEGFASITGKAFRETAKALGAVFDVDKNVIDAALAVSRAQERASKSRIDASRTERVNSRRDRLEKLRADRLEREKAITESGLGDPDAFAERFAAILDGVNSGAERARGTSRGTFSGDFARRLGSSASDRLTTVVERGVQALEKTGQNVERIVRKAEGSGGLVITT